MAFTISNVGLGLYYLKTNLGASTLQMFLTADELKDLKKILEEAGF